MTAQEKKSEHVEKHGDSKSSGVESARTEANAGMGKLSGDRKALIQFLKEGGKSGISLDFGKPELVDSKKGHYKSTSEKHGAERSAEHGGHAEKHSEAVKHEAVSKNEHRPSLSNIKGLDHSNGQLQIGNEHYAVRDGQLHRQHADAHGKQSVDEKACGQLSDGGKVKFQDGKSVDLNHTDSLVNLTDSKGGHHRILSAGGKQIDLDSMKKDADHAVKNAEADREHYNKSLTFTAGVGEFMARTIGGGGTLSQAIDTTVQNITGQQQRVNQMEQDLISGKVSGQDLSKMADKLTVASKGIEILSHDVKDSTKSAGEAQKAANELTVGTVAAVATAGAGAIVTEAMVGGAAVAETAIAAGAAETGITAAGEVGAQVASKAAGETLSIGQSIIKGAVEGVTKGTVEGVGKVDSQTKASDVVTKVVHSGIEGALSAGAGESVQSLLSKGGKEIAKVAHDHVDDAMKGLSAAQRHIARQVQEAKEAAEGIQHLVEKGSHKAAKKAAEKATEIAYKNVAEHPGGEHEADKGHHEVGAQGLVGKVEHNIAKSDPEHRDRHSDDVAGGHGRPAGEHADLKPHIVASQSQPGDLPSVHGRTEKEPAAAKPDIATPAHQAGEGHGVQIERTSEPQQDKSGFSGQVEDLTPGQLKSALDSYNDLDDVAHLLSAPPKQTEFSSTAGSEAVPDLGRSTEVLPERNKEATTDAREPASDDAAGKESLLKLLEQRKLELPSAADLSQLELDRQKLESNCNADTKSYDNLRKVTAEKNEPLELKILTLESINKENKVWAQIYGSSAKQSYDLADTLQRVGIGSPDLFTNRPEYPSLNLNDRKACATIEQAIDRQPGMDSETKEHLKSKLKELKDLNEKVEQSKEAVADFAASGKQYFGPDGKPAVDYVGGLTREQFYKQSAVAGDYERSRDAFARELADKGINPGPEAMPNAGRSESVRLENHQDFEKVRMAINSASLTEEQRQKLKDQLTEVKICQERENQIGTNNSEIDHLRKQVTDNQEPLRKPFEQLKDERQALAEVEALLKVGALASNLDAIDRLTDGKPDVRQSIYEALARIAGSSDAAHEQSTDTAPTVSADQRLLLIADLTRQIANPDTIKQGDKKTCGLAESEFELAKKHPDQYARYVADLVVTGITKLQPYDTKDAGGAVKVEDSNLSQLKVEKDLISANTKQYDDDNPDRSLASKVFQTAAADWIAYKDSKGSYQDGKLLLKSTLVNSGIDVGFEQHGGEEVTRQDGTFYKWDGVRAPGIAELTSRLTGEKFKPVYLSKEVLTGDQAQMEKVKADFYDVLKNQQFPIKVGMCLTKGDFTGMNAVDGHELAIMGVDKEKDLVYIYNTAMPTDSAKPYSAVKTEDLLTSMYRKTSDGTPYIGSLIVKE
jgi:hypothetical protein